MLRCIFLRLCQEVCPEEAIFLAKRILAHRHAAARNDLQQGEKRGGTVGWRPRSGKHKLEEAKEQENFR